LIQKIKAENLSLRSEFADLIRNSRANPRNSNVFMASDFGAYGYCENSFYLKLRGFVSRNLYELKQGRLYHGEYSKADYTLNQNTEYLKDEVEDFRSVQWFRGRNLPPVFNEKMKMVGIPDGLVYFADEKRALVEVKSTRQLPVREPFWGDVLQACAYQKICSGGNNSELRSVDSDVFILYVQKDSGSRRLFRINSHNHGQEFEETRSQMQQTQYNSNLYQSPAFEKKCAACGYRHVCETKK
jgi:CRISPR/Cas system-associated exonuclease Cas4 (RecB family)